MVSREQVVEGTSREISLFLGRRLRKLRTEISGVLNINPFLLCALQDFHKITDQYSLGSCILNWHLGSGHATSFGKMIDERLLPNVFQTIRLDTTLRDQRPYNSPPFDDIDHLVRRSDGEYLLSLKASSWTIQYGQAMGLYNNFRQLGNLGFQGSGIVVGVFYGNKGLLTDKYRIVRGQNIRRQDILEKLDYVDVKAGAAFWAWLNDDEEATQDWVLEGVQNGVKDFSELNADMEIVVGGAAQLLAKELQVKYGLPVDGTLSWSFLLHAINNEREGSIGKPLIDSPTFFDLGNSIEDDDEGEFDTSD